MAVQPLSGAKDFVIGTLGDRITVQALPTAQAGHQLTVRNRQDQVLSTTRFTFK